MYKSIDRKLKSGVMTNSSTRVGHSATINVRFSISDSVGQKLWHNINTTIKGELADYEPCGGTKVRTLWRHKCTNPFWLR